MRVGGKRILSLLCLVTMLTGCGSAQEVPQLLEPVQAQKDYVRVEYGELSEQTFYNAYVTPEIVQLSFPTDGRIKSCEKSMGEMVQEGEVLAILDGEDIDKQIKQLKEQKTYLEQMTAYDVALMDKEIAMNQYMLQMNYQKAQELEQQTEEIKAAMKTAQKAKKKATVSGNTQPDPAEELSKELALTQEEKGALAEEINDLNHANGAGKAQQEAEKRLRAIDAEQCSEQIQELEKQKELASLKSTVTGEIVAAIDPLAEVLQTGSQVEADVPAYYIADESKHYLVLDDISTSEWNASMEAYATIGKEQYRLTAADYTPQEKQKARSNSVNLPLRFSLEESLSANGAAQAMRKSGDFVSVVIKKKVHQNVLYMPKEALFSNGSENYVTRRKADGTEENVIVKAGSSTTQYVEIREGLAEGDLVAAKTVSFDTDTGAAETLMAGDASFTGEYVLLNSSAVKREEYYCQADSARIEEFYVEDGQEVKKGDALVKLSLYSNASYRMEAQYQLEKQKKEQAQTVAKMEHDIAVNKSKSWECEQAGDEVGKRTYVMQADYLTTALEQLKVSNAYEEKQAEEALQELRNENDKGVIKAGIDGQAKFAEGKKIGQSVVKGDSICDVCDLSNQLYRIKDESNLKYNMEVEVDYLNRDGEKTQVKGRILTASNVIPAWIYNQGIFRAYSLLVFEDGTTIDIRSDSEIKVKAVTQKYDDTILLSSDMILEDSYGTYVYVQEGEQRMKQRVGVTNVKNGQAAVLYGLESGAVIYHGKEVQK